MTDLREVIDRHVAIWNKPDEPRRRLLIAQAFTEDAGYLGPLLGG